MVSEKTERRCSMKTRIIHTRFWEDEKMVELSREAKLLFLYLFTNSRINLIGIYELADRIIKFETGLNAEELSKAKDELQDLQRVMFHNNWIYVVNAIKHSNYTGEKNEIAKEKEIQKVPKEVLDYFETEGFEIPYRYSIDGPITYKQRTEKQEPINNKEEIDLDEVFK